MDIAFALPAVTSTSALVRGASAGSLNAVTGPDHLAILMPKCIGRRWDHAARIGAFWGTGNGLSPVLMGAGAFYLKEQLSSLSPSPAVGDLAELVVGLSLIALGLIGYRDARNGHGHHDISTVPEDSPAAALFLNGLLYGFSLDGAPLLAPVLGFDSWGPAMLFLLAYGAGTALWMSAAASLIGESSAKAVQGDPSLGRKLAEGSAFFSVAIGLYWAMKAVMHVH